jgi:anti-anti-sigma factor
MSEPTPAGGLAQPGNLVVRRVREPDGYLLLCLYGELDLASSAALEVELRMLGPADSERVMIDLSGLEFMDVAGVQALMRAQRYIAESGGRLSLLRGPINVQRVFELTGTLRRFRFED